MCNDIEILIAKKDALEKELETEENVAKCLELQNRISALLHKIQARKDRNRHFPVEMPEYSIPKGILRY